MAQYVDTNTRIFEADAAIAKYARVVLEADGKIVTAGLTDKEVGTALTQAFATGDKIAVKLRTGAGSHKMIAVEAITVGSTVYTEASGKVQDTAAPTSLIIGTALGTSAADGDIIEVEYSSHGDSAVDTNAIYIPDAVQQTLAAGGGAVTITEYYTAGASDAGGDAWTLADGSVTGQLKKIQLITDGGGDATLTPATAFADANTTCTFADVGDYCVLRWNGSAWQVIELGNDADGATAPVLA